MKNKILGSALMIAGTTIGAGMLFYAINLSRHGIFHDVSSTAGLWLLLTYTGLLFMEVYQTAKKKM